MNQRKVRVLTRKNENQNFWHTPVDLSQINLCTMLGEPGCFDEVYDIVYETFQIHDHKKLWRENSE